MTIDRRAFLAGSTALGAGTLLPAAALTAARALPLRVRPAPTANRAPLAAQPFQPLPAGSIRPAGWLRRQFHIQAASLGGRLDETWPDVGPTSGWLGGTGESWERGPYWLDGLVPLAWALDDAALKAKAMRFIDWTLGSARPDGMFGPASNDDWWPRMVALKVLTQYHELTGDPRVVPLMTAYFAYQLEQLPGRPLRDWGRFRWQDNLVSVLWLYNRTGDARLIRLARLLEDQGYDWRGGFADFRFTGKVRPEQIGLETEASRKLNDLKDPALAVHGVNNAMGLKASPVWSLVSGDAADRDAVHHQLTMLDEWHGQPTGMFSADEHLAGREPSQGVETCTVVETLYSLELALAITGDPAIADRIERIAYNALPAAFTDDMWSHQYDQQPNQVACTRSKGPWTTNGPEANLFGLDPHFGCCTANFHQGWPKLGASLWMACADGGLAAMLYAPCEVATTVGGVPVRIAQTTDYPFRHTVSIRVDPARAAAFPIKLRVPGWARAATISVNGHTQPAVAPGGFATITRTWHAGDRIELAFAALPHIVEGYRRALSIADGPLLFALPIDEQWRKWRQRGLSADWEVVPQGPWAFALAPDAMLRRIDRPVPPVPFTRHAPAVTIVTQVKAVHGWTLIDGAAAPVPAQPATGAVQQVTLIPYAAAKLRLTAFANTS